MTRERPRSSMIQNRRAILEAGKIRIKDYAVVNEGKIQAPKVPYYDPHYPYVKQTESEHDVC
jgi:hypothetical protein